MHIIEGTIAWEPIPAHVNHVWAVDVVHLEELFHPNATELRIAVASSWQDPVTHDKTRAAWQITFPRCLGYRMRFHGYPGNLPLTRPDGEAACWEICRRSI